MGQLNISVTYGETTLEATLVVLGYSGPDLCGRDVIKAFEQHGKQVLAIGIKAAPGKPSSSKEALLVGQLLGEFHDLFSEVLGVIKGPPVELHLREGAVPRFLKEHAVPYAMREAVSGEIECLVETGILTTVAYSDWATPLVPVVKRMGQYNFAVAKVTANAACHTEKYPLPKSKISSLT